MQLEVAFSAAQKENFGIDKLYQNVLYSNINNTGMKMTRTITNPKLKYSTPQYARAIKELQLRNHKGQLHTITPKQQQKIIDIIQQHGFGLELQNYLHKIQVINKYTTV